MINVMGFLLHINIVNSINTTYTYKLLFNNMNLLKYKHLQLLKMTITTK